MENITEYKRNFQTKRIADDNLSLPQTYEMQQVKRIGEHIADMDVSISDAINSVFDKTERPVLIVCDDIIEYVNQSFLKMLGITDITRVLNEKFLKFVSQDDWDFIAENIGDILTTNGVLELRMLNANYKVIKTTFDTLYIDDKMHFCFVLIGRPVEVKVSASAVLYDEQVGLPKFSLFEYRVQSAIDYENYKNPTIKRAKVVVCGVAIKNYTAFKNDGQSEFIIQRMAEKLLLGLNKLYTVAIGSKYQFWIVMPDMQSQVEIEQELANIQNLLNQPISNALARYDVSVAMGVSVYPDTAQSAKKMIAQAEMAIRQALKEKKSEIVFFGN
ncbi:MAG: diguanylate cyclase [Alphaproteobacteria bacterium]|nr:diguanylate cyclase [Alphaproteobacteria bacterium]